MKDAGTDKSGSPLAGAAIRGISVSTSASRDAVTGVTGSLLVNGIRAGRYNLVVTPAGFGAPTAKLDAGDVSESITVALPCAAARQQAAAGFGSRPVPEERCAG